MASEIILSNGNLSISLDSYGQVQKIIFPNTCMANHVGSNSLHHKIGLYCEDAVHWLDDGSWKIKQSYYPGRLISRTIANNLWLGIRLEIQDFVDSDLDALIRNIHVINLSGRRRSAKLFVYQDFVFEDNASNISTAQYIPANVIDSLSQPAILHFYDNKGFAISGKSFCGNGMDYSVGHFGKYDGNYMSGAWCDAADGKLAKNNCETGQTDSIIGLPIELSPHDSCRVMYYLAAGQSISEVCQVLEKVAKEDSHDYAKTTSDHWLSWLQPAIDYAKNNVRPEDRYDFIDLILKLRAQILNNGSVIDKSIKEISVPTNYTSPLSSVLAAATLVELGLDIDAARIYDFYISPLERDHMLYPNYLLSGGIGPNKLPFALDNDCVVPPIFLADTALLLISLCQSINYAFAKTIPLDWKKRWRKLGVKLADFLADYIDPISKLPISTYHYNDPSKAKHEIEDALLVYTALISAANISDRLKDVDAAIKYQAVSGDIADALVDIHQDIELPADSDQIIARYIDNNFTDSYIVSLLSKIRSLVIKESSSKHDL